VKVDKAHAYIIHEVPDAETSFWPDDGLVERSMAHAMEFTEKKDLAGVELVLELDKERSARFTHSMQKDFQGHVVHSDAFLLCGLARTGLNGGELQVTWRGKPWASVDFVRYPHEHLE
ncbi:unnamed protein product, partial [Closterium sp. Naga37s-1]